MGPREFYEELPSTQERAIALAREGAREGTIVVARRQTGGRGRLTRRWESPAGGLYCSVVVARPQEHPGFLPLSVGAHLASAFRTRYSVPVVLKWPNDLLVHQPGRPTRKLAGVLADEVPSPALGHAVVTGVGVNVRLVEGSLPEVLANRVAALEEFAVPAPRLEEVERTVATEVVRAARSLSQPAGVIAARDLCRRMLYGVGRRISVDGRPAGVLEDLGDEGELWVSTDTDRVSIWAGDVQVQEAP